VGATPGGAATVAALVTRRHRVLGRVVWSVLVLLCLVVWSLAAVGALYLLTGR